MENVSGKSSNKVVKKVLPATPVSELTSSSVSILDRSTNTKQTQAYNAFFLEYSLISE